MRRCSLSRAPEETRASALRLARALAQEAPDGLLVSLSGPLGVGKTVFVKGLAEGLGVDPERVSSPTFVIANRYASDSGSILHHVDCYRLESVDELESVGFFDLLEPGAVVAVEWGDRFAAALPQDRLEVRLLRERAEPEIEAGDNDLRRLKAVARGPRAARVLARWCASDQAADTNASDGGREGLG